jgi:aryl-alcohol dehydrogenase-like predicted oxidoreductase
VITGASRVEQIAENMKAIEVAARITPDLQQRIEDIVVDMEQ